MDNESEAQTITGCTKQRTKVGKGMSRDLGNGGFYPCEQQRGIGCQMHGRLPEWNRRQSPEMQITIGKIQNMDY